MSVLISVVCPTYNSGSFIKKTLETVMAQTEAPHELVISDDGSSDDTLERASEALRSMPFKTQLLKNAHKGPGATRNAGIKAVTGNWVAFLDSDDLWFPSKIEAVKGAIANYKDVNLICHSEIHSRWDGVEGEMNFAAMYRPGQNLTEQLYRNLLFHTSAVTCSKDLLLQAGLFDESLMSGQDVELWLRMSPWMRVHFIAEAHGYYVDRKGNVTSGNAEKRLADTLRLYWRHRHKVGNRLVAWSLIKIFGAYAKRKVKAKIFNSWNGA